MFEQCVCGNQQSYFSCCKPYLEGGVPAPTAEALMRSRFSAYVTKNVDYLLATYHDSAPHRPTREALLRNLEGVEWQSLNVIRAVPGRDDNEAFVEFSATYRGADILLKALSSKTKQMEERSRFVRENGCWYYVDASPLQKIERNAPCTCGSGKKYKQCCLR